MKFLNYFLSLLLVTALVVGCEDSSSDVDQENLDNQTESTDPDDGSSDSEGEGEQTTDEATVSFQIDGVDIEPTDTLTIGNSGCDTLKVYLISNQDISTYELDVESADSTQWCEAYMSDTTTLTIVTLSKNIDYDKRAATITVTVGSDDDTASAALNIAQYPDEAPYITLSSPTLDIANYATASDYITFESNQPNENITVELLDDSPESIFDYTLGANKITFEAKSINTDVETRSEIYVVSATIDGKVDADTITVIQAAFVPATVSFSPTSVELTNEVGSSNSVEVTTNQATSSIKAEIADSLNYEVSVSGTTVTVKSKSVNNAATTVKVYVGDEDNNTTDTFTVTQTSEVRISADLTAVTIAKYDEGSYQVEISTNQADTSISYEFTAGGDYFGASRSGTILTISPKSNNTSEANYTGTLKVTSTSPTNSNYTEISVTQLCNVLIGDYISEGLVFWIAEDESSVKVVHPVGDFPVQWYDELKATVLVGADDEDDGEYNMTMIKSASDYDTDRYNIVEWCENLGSGWYLPARYELWTLLEIASGSDFAATLLAYDGTAIEEEYYWSSTEASATNAYSSKYSDNSIYDNNYGKYNSSKGGRYVRAIKKVTLQ